MNPVFARCAVPADDVDIVRLRSLAAKEAPRHRGEPFRRGQGSGLLTIVGGVGDSVFGCADISCTDEGIWTIHAVHVEEPARGVGIADAMVGLALRELRARGAKRVESGAQPGDRSLKNLFERHGLVARTIIVGREL